MAEWELPGYELLELVGFGATGEVWRARELISGDVVALKRMRSADPLARERLRREAAVLSSVAGEHIVRLRDVVVTDALAVLVMDYAAGGNLASVLAVRGTLAAPEVVTLIGPLAAALADAHRRGIVHGDVTPGNIVFTADGRPLLTDFGVARVVDVPATALEATSTYAAPEVLAGAAPTPAADVYALCKVAAAALDRATAPPALCEAVERGLDPDEHARPAARELATEVLTACAAAPVRLVRTASVAPTELTQPVVTPRPQPVAEISLEPRRWTLPAMRLPRPVALSVAAVLGLVTAVVGGVAWGHRTQSSAAVLSPTRARSAQAAPPTPGLEAMPVWRDVVAHYDDVRTQAFATGDTTLLASIYANGGAALSRDSATLQTFAAHGWHVRGLHVTTHRVVPDVVTPSAATLVVTDEMSAYSVVDAIGDVVQTVGARRSTTFAMQLTRVGASWRIESVSR